MSERLRGYGDMSVTCISCSRYDECSEGGSRTTKFYGTEICAGNVNVLCEDFNPLDPSKFTCRYELISDTLDRSEDVEVEINYTKHYYYVVYSATSTSGQIVTGASYVVRSKPVTAFSDIAELSGDIAKWNDFTHVVITWYVKLSENNLSPDQFIDNITQKGEENNGRD